MVCTGVRAHLKGEHWTRSFVGSGRNRASGDVRSGDLSSSTLSACAGCPGNSTWPTNAEHTWYYAQARV